MKDWIIKTIEDMTIPHVNMGRLVGDRRCLGCGMRPDSCHCEGWNAAIAQLKTKLKDYKDY